MTRGPARSVSSMMCESAGLVGFKTDTDCKVSRHKITAYRHANSKNTTGTCKDRQNQAKLILCCSPVRASIICAAQPRVRHFTCGKMNNAVALAHSYAFLAHVRGKEGTGASKLQVN